MRSNYLSDDVRNRNCFHGIIEDKKRQHAPKFEITKTKAQYNHFQRRTQRKSYTIELRVFHHANPLICNFYKLICKQNKKISISN